jgi:hypothetical protein
MQALAEKVRARRGRRRPRAPARPCPAPARGAATAPAPPPCRQHPPVATRRARAWASAAPSSSPPAWSATTARWPAPAPRPHGSAITAACWTPSRRTPRVGVWEGAGGVWWGLRRAGVARAASHAHRRPPRAPPNRPGFATATGRLLTETPMPQGAPPPAASAPQPAAAPACLAPCLAPHRRNQTWTLSKQAHPHPRAASPTAKSSRRTPKPASSRRCRRRRRPASTRACLMTR